MVIFCGIVDSVSMCEYMEVVMIKSRMEIDIRLVLIRIC